MSPENNRFNFDRQPEQKFLDYLINTLGIDKDTAWSLISIKDGYKMQEVIGGNQMTALQYEESIANAFTSLAEKLAPYANIQRVNQISLTRPPKTQAPGFLQRLIFALTCYGELLELQIDANNNHVATYYQRATKSRPAKTYLGALVADKRLRVSEDYTLFVSAHENPSPNSPTQVDKIKIPPLIAIFSIDSYALSL